MKGTGWSSTRVSGEITAGRGEPASTWVPSPFFRFLEWTGWGLYLSRFRPRPTETPVLFGLGCRSPRSRRTHCVPDRSPVQWLAQGQADVPKTKVRDGRKRRFEPRQVWNWRGPAGILNQGFRLAK